MAAWVHGPRRGRDPGHPRSATGGADPVSSGTAGDEATVGPVSGYGGGVDEMLDAAGPVRTAWTELATQLDWAGPAGLIARAGGHPPAAGRRRGQLPAAG